MGVVSSAVSPACAGWKLLQCPRGRRKSEIIGQCGERAADLDTSLIKDIPIDEELGVRIQALESLIRSGSSLDPDSASTAAMETILHATRAANSGSQDATTALAQLTESALSGSGIGGMSADAQSSLLMEVLQQVSVTLSARHFCLLWLMRDVAVFRDSRTERRSRG